MAYATIADLEARLSVAMLQEATAATQGQADYTAACQRALDVSSAKVDSYAGTRHGLPLTATEQVQAVVLDLAAVEVTKPLGGMRKSDQECAEKAEEWLRDLGKGLVTLEDGVVEQTVAPSFAVKSGEDDPLRYSDTNLEAF